MYQSAPRAFSGWLISLSAFCLLAGCVPHVGHGPRIDPGTRYYLDAGFVHANELQDERIALVPTLYVGASRGWIASDSSSALLAGLQVPVYLMPFVFSRQDLETLLATSYIDVYAQPRRSPDGELDYGVGGLLSTGVLMPYVQVGRSTDEGAYTTQGVAYTFGSLNSQTYWLPAIAFRSVRPDGRRAVSFYTNAAIELGSSDREWFIGFGVLIEFLRKP